MTTTEWMGVIGAGLVGAAVGSLEGGFVAVFSAAGAIGGALIILALGRS